MTLNAVKVELSKLYKQIKAKEIEANHGKALVYTLSTLADIIKGADLETLLNRIERNGEHRGDAGTGAETSSAPSQH